MLFHIPGARQLSKVDANRLEWTAFESSRCRRWYRYDNDISFRWWETLYNGACARTTCCVLRSLGRVLNVVLNKIGGVGRQKNTLLVYVRSYFTNWRDFLSLMKVNGTPLSLLNVPSAPSFAVKLFPHIFMGLQEDIIVRVTSTCICGEILLLHRFSSSLQRFYYTLVDSDCT